MKAKIDYLRVIRNEQPTSILVNYDAYDFDPALDVYEDRFLMTVEVHTENKIETYKNVHFIDCINVNTKFNVISPNEYIIHICNNEEVTYTAGIETFEVYAETEEEKKLRKLLDEIHK